MPATAASDDRQTRRAPVQARINPLARGVERPQSGVRREEHTMEDSGSMHAELGEDGQGDISPEDL
ncbi:hypothetical protein DY023_14640 [Microbacterium bovistercoris]|uniref:Uncharacterized protein n=1 Tax=Microbacterium bovistercoris TaxID=2293570 RepID=A0A371NST1_9MICO|nr:hypothetical protein DY023_14640 [Microbacterium bovistercoris]